jgi:hypothetical protein
LHILLDLENHAFLGWKKEDEPWTKKTCEKYIEWCHIDKLFAHSEHKKHCRFHAANLHRCRDPDFVERCIQIYQHVNDTAFVRRNECNISIMRMVYAEVKLNRMVDWRSLQKSPQASESIDIPRERKFKDEGGLSKTKSFEQPIADACVEWSDDSDVDDKSGCTQEEMVQKLKTLRDVELGQFLEEFLDKEETPERIAVEMEETRPHGSFAEPSHRNDPIAQHLADLDKWESNQEQAMMSEEVSHPLDKSTQFTEPENTSLLKEIEDLKIQLQQDKENHCMQIENLMREFSIKEEAYQKKIEDLEHFIRLAH